MNLTTHFLTIVPFWSRFEVSNLDFERRVSQILFVKKSKILSMALFKGDNHPIPRVIKGFKMKFKRSKRGVILAF
jgi:hypothetical protein